jgi:hypothetical protein
MPPALRWSTGLAIGLVGAATAVLVLLLAGLMTDRGGALISEAGALMLPSVLAAASGLSAGAAYLVVHTMFYLAAGAAAVVLTRLVDRVHVLTVGLVLVIIIVEMGFLVFSTEAAARGRIDTFAWRSLLIAHAAADLVFVLLLLRVHPSLLTDLRAGYDT